MMNKRVVPALLAAAVLGLFCGRDHAGGGCADSGLSVGGIKAFLVCFEAAIAELAMESAGKDEPGYATSERDTMIKKISPAARDSGSPDRLHSFTRKTTGVIGAPSTGKTTSAARRERLTGVRTAASDTGISYNMPVRGATAAAESDTGRTGIVNEAGSKEAAGGSVMTRAADKKNTVASPQKEIAAGQEELDTAVVTEDTYTAPGGLLDKPRVEVPEVK